ncbi:hypothetical protein ACFVGY_31540 [Streptomyces sp. NPDC127106]|uniref:hypothetical protein n=1 Tax=Streptomyces sp. NPDC127106 TaxID=3345360 RepID=UPI0036381C7E
MVSEERAAYEGRSRQRRDRIVELHRQGLKGYEIARELSVSPGLVSIRLKEARAAGVDLTPTTLPIEVVDEPRTSNPEVGASDPQVTVVTAPGPAVAPGAHADGPPPGRQTGHQAAAPANSSGR